jgi:hypothetical protein
MLFVGACRKEEAPATATRRAATSTTPPPGPPNVNVAIRLAPGEISRCELGTALGESGTVDEAKTAIAKKDPVYISIWLSEAPEELQVSAKFLDGDGTEAAVVRKDDAGGAKVVTLKLDKSLKPGTYKVEGYWGGNLGCEKTLEIE